MYAQAYPGQSWLVPTGKKGDHDKAIVDSTEAIRPNPTCRGILWRAWSYHKKGDHDKAIADYTAAIRLNPEYAKLIIAIGVVDGDRRATTTKRS